MLSGREANGVCGAGLLKRSVDDKILVIRRASILRALWQDFYIVVILDIHMVSQICL